MTTYSSYMQADKYPVYFVTGVVCVIGASIACVMFFRIKKRTNVDHLEEIPCFNGMYAAASSVFGDGIRKDSSNANTK